MSTWTGKLRGLWHRPKRDDGTAPYQRHERPGGERITAIGKNLFPTVSRQARWLRLHARTLADGVCSGMHRSHRHGAGVEFGGQRPYVTGDDLRWIDRRALMRHDRLMVRLFETETDRGLHLLVDATASMGFAGSDAPCSKIDYAAVLA